MKISKVTDYAALNDIQIFYSSKLIQIHNPIFYMYSIKLHHSVFYMFSLIQLNDLIFDITYLPKYVSKFP